MKNYTLLFVLLAGIMLSCSSYSVKKEITDESNLKAAKKIGVVMRVSKKSRVSRDEALTNLSRSLSGFKHIKQIDIIPDLPETVIDFINDEDRFFQTSSDSEYLKYKSMGILKNYLRENSDELKKAIEKNGCDGLVFYEVYSVISSEMQLMRFDTVVAMVDRDLNIVYLDHQDNTKEATDSDVVVLKTDMMNHITKRFIEKMLDFGYLKEL